jgi:hypothetical protein
MTKTELSATIDQTKLLRRLGMPAPTPKPEQFADTYHLPELVLLVMERLPPTLRLCYTPAPGVGQVCAFDLLSAPGYPLAFDRTHYPNVSPAAALASLLIDLLKFLPQAATATPSNGHS